jgi:hypothetical protein
VLSLFYCVPAFYLSSTAKVNSNETETQRTREGKKGRRAKKMKKKHQNVVDLKSTKKANRLPAAAKKTAP